MLRKDGGVFCLNVIDRYNEYGEVIFGCGNVKVIGNFNKSSLGRRWDKKFDWNKFKREEDDRKWK